MTLQMQEISAAPSSNTCRLTDGSQTLVTTLYNIYIFILNNTYLVVMFEGIRNILLIS